MSDVSIAVVIASVICLASIIVSEHGPTSYKRSLAFGLALLGGAAWLGVAFLFLTTSPDVQASETQVTESESVSTVQTWKRSGDINIPHECGNGYIGACLH
jgi:hypothetical protein